MADTESLDLDGIRTYKKRFLIAGLIIIQCGLTFLQRVEYSSISSLVGNYYSLKEEKVEFAANLFPLVYILVVHVVINFTELWGLTATIVVAGACNSLGACIKCFAGVRDGFFILLVGQLLIAISQTILMTAYPLIVAVWFGAKEIATAKAFLNSSITLGTIIGVFLPSSVSAPDVSNYLSTLAILIAFISVIIFIITVAVMDEKPRRPPTLAERFKMTQLEWGILLTNWDYICIVIGFVIVTYCVSILANALSLAALPVAVTGIGKPSIPHLFIYLPSVFVPVFGYWLDTTKNFKGFANFLYFCILMSVLLLWTSVPLMSEAVMFISIVLLCFASNIFLAVGQDMVLEIVYPFSELRAIGFLQMLNSLVIFSSAYYAPQFTTRVGPMCTILILLLLLVIGFVSILSIKWDLRRQNVEVSTPLRPCSSKTATYSRL